MLKISVEEDCGNAPKKIFLRDFNIAFAEGNNEYLLESISDDITWNLVGNQVVQGKEKFVQELEKMLSSKASELIIYTIITHGNAGTINGTMSFEDGSIIAFCDVYLFSGYGPQAKIKTITSYGIDL